MIHVRISAGEAADRWTILRIKRREIRDEAKRQKAQDQFDHLTRLLEAELGSG